MFEIKNNEKNKSAVILNPERSEWVSRSHVTSVEIVVNDGVKTKRYSAKRDLYARSPKGSRLKMTEKTLSLSGASSEPIISAESKKNKPRYSVNCCAISEYDLLLASPKGSLHRHPERSEGSIKNNIKDWILRFANAPLRMTIPALALIFTLITTSESWADESATTAEDTTQTQEEQKLLSDSGSCGNGCLYQITTDATTGKQNLRVYNDPDYTGTTKSIRSSAFAGKGNNTNGKYQEFYANATFDKITIDGDFDTIGYNAFWRNGASEVVFNGNIKNIGYAAFEYNNFTSVDLPEGLQKIGGEAFLGNSISSIVIPDSVTSIDNWGFANQNIGTVYISDNLDVLGSNGNVYRPFGKNFSMICKGDIEKCQSLVKEYQLSDSSTTTDLSDRVTGVDKEHCTGEKYFWNGTSCSRKETYCDKDMYYSGYECRMRPTDGSEITCDYDISGYIKVGNNCYSPEVTYAKKHYTPAEANQWLKDDDNFVVLTFKK